MLIKICTEISGGERKWEKLRYEGILFSYNGKKNVDRQMGNNIKLELLENDVTFSFFRLFASPFGKVGREHERRI